MVALTPESRAFLLERARTGKLATVRADGSPHIAPIWFDLDGETLVFTTWHSTVKAQNMRQNHRVSLCVDDEQPPFSFITIEGTATLSDDAAELKKWATRLAGRYMGQEQAEAYGTRNSVEGELVVRITPTRVTFRRNIAD